MTMERTNQENTNLPSIFIDGYFTQLIDSGVRPKCGYPTNHLPKSKVARMTVVTSFVASRKNK